MGKGKKRGGKRGQGTRAVTVVNPTEAMERRLASAQDAVHYVGKLLINDAVSSSVSVPLSLVPGNMGVRAAAMSVIFANYRYKEVIFEFAFSSAPAGLGLCAIGFLDDASGEGDAPTSIGGVLELRCSGINYGAVTVPTSVQWKPADKTWKYTTPSSGGDPRFVNPYGLYAAATGTGVLIGSVTFSLVFKGAVDVGSSIPDYVDIPPITPSSRPQQSISGSLRRVQ